MKILIISQYFWPENFKINDICIGLKERGHHVSILTGNPNYPQGKFYEGYSFKSISEKWNDMTIYRSKLIPRGKGGVQLFINYLSFVFFASLKVFDIKEKFDVILVFEPSPITVGLPAIVASKKMKIPYYFWVQDLWPESLTAAGGIKNPIILNFFDKITRYIYKKSKKVLVQSEGFKEYIKKQNVPEDKIIFYPNSTENFYKEEIPQNSYLEKLPLGFKIIFAGNLGEAQSLTTLVDAAEIVEKSNLNVQWIFIGDGRFKNTLQEYIKNKNLKNIHFLGSFPSTEMPSFFACADALVLSLKKDKIFSLTIPSKLQSYMACGKPILASLDGEGAKIVEISKCGFSSPSEDALKLAENVKKIYFMDQAERNKLGENAKNFFKENFDREKLLSKLIQILNGY